MALIPTLSLVTVAQDASSVTVTDNTGDYSSTNLGGYGSPNPLKADIQGAILQLYSLCSPSTFIYYKPSTLTALQSAGGQLLPAALFSGITTGTTYPDAVYGMKYDLLYTGTGTINYTGGSKQFSLTDADDQFAIAVGFVLPDNTSKIYYIDKTKTLDGSGGYVTEALPATGGTVTFQQAYEGDLKLMIDKAGEACLTEDIGIWATDGCKDENFKNIWPRFQQRIALKAKFTQGYIYDANKLALSLAADCGCVNTQGCC